MTAWLKDDNGNKCSVEYFGTKEAAQKALDSLKNCRDCINCSRCSDCSGCSGCSGCSNCSRCSRCSGCSGCSNCSRCSDCSGCSGCSNCSNCSRCSRCSRCSDCSDCSRCSRCSNCSGCSNIAFLYFKKDLKGDPTSEVAPGAPPIPVIENIHTLIYEATSKPGALKMDNWHTCGTTHCRAGWVVHLAGDAGYALERFHNTALAAQLIYRESGYPINPGRFYDSNAEALADMKKLAGVEQ
jgi:hypothetical protein